MSLGAVKQPYLVMGLGKEREKRSRDEESGGRRIKGHRLWMP